MGGREGVRAWVQIPVLEQHLWHLAELSRCVWHCNFRVYGPKTSRKSGLNPRPLDQESTALTARLPRPPDGLSSNPSFGETCAAEKTLATSAGLHCKIVQSFINTAIDVV